MTNVAIGLRFWKSGGELETSVYQSDIHRWASWPTDRQQCRHSRGEGGPGGAGTITCLLSWLLLLLLLLLLFFVPVVGAVMINAASFGALPFEPSLRKQIAGPLAQGV